MRRNQLSLVCLVLVVTTAACGSSSTSTTTTNTTTTTSAAPASATLATTSGSADTSSTISAPSTTTPAAASTAPVTAPVTAPPTTSPATAPSTIASTSPATAAPTTAASAAGTNPCTTSQLRVTLGPTDGAAGNQYTPIVFTNGGPSTCTLVGYPGVSFVDAAGNQVGEAAQRIAVATPTVTLAVGAQAHATMDYHDPGFFDNCAPAATVSVKIYPPNQTEALALPFPSALCTKPIPEPELTIDTVRPGPTLTAGEPG